MRSRQIDVFFSRGRTQWKSSEPWDTEEIFVQCTLRSSATFEKLSETFTKSLSQTGADRCHQRTNFRTDEVGELSMPKLEQRGGIGWKQSTKGAFEVAYLCGCLHLSSVLNHAETFNDIVSMGVNLWKITFKEHPRVKTTLHVLNILDAASGTHIAIQIADQTAETIWKAFATGWLRWAGSP